MNILFYVLVVLSMISLFYYIAILIYSGLGTAFSGFWLYLGITGLFFAILMKYFLIHKITVADAFAILLLIIVTTGVLIFILIEIVLICNSKQKPESGIDYMIILGAQLKGNIISKTLLKRLDTAIVYLKSNPDTYVIVSGGKGEDEALSEAEAMKQYLMSKGIAEQLIIKEDKSKNTFENILYSKPFIKNVDRAVIVTNGFHIFRSLRIAKKQGLNAQGLAAPTDKLLALNYYVREAIGVIKDKLFGNI